MKLIKISYKSPDWELSNFELGKLNLVVGKNAIGKSRSLDIINEFHQIVTQNMYLHGNDIWKIELVNSKQQQVVFEYSLKDKEHVVSINTETITIDGEQILVRDGNNHTVKLKNYITGKEDIIHPPADKLTLHVNRDTRKYPYLEEIINWTNQSYGLKFANTEENNLQYGYGISLFSSLSELFKQLNRESRNHVIQVLNSIGYNISNIMVRAVFKNTLLYVKEKNIKKNIPSYDLSQGMFRALATIIYIEYVISKKKPALIIIDDLCEGLDYEKAKKLGQFVFERCENSEIQLVATSNDSFLMDIIDIKHWNILQRNGSKVTSLNSNTHQEVFRKFRLTGLSNFDFFLSDFLQQQTI
jgi:energy-coupling factor transporter ATP-binding protein EcfA2